MCVCVPKCFFGEQGQAIFLNSPLFLSSPSPSRPLSTHTYTHPIRRKMPAYHHPPVHRLTVPLIFLLLAAGGLVLTSIRSYPTPQTINETLQKVLAKPTQTSLNDLFDTIGSHPDRESTADYNYCQARRPDTKTYPTPKVNDATVPFFLLALKNEPQKTSYQQTISTVPMPMQSLGQGCKAGELTVVCASWRSVRMFPPTEMHHEKCTTYDITSVHFLLIQPNYSTIPD